MKNSVSLILSLSMMSFPMWSFSKEKPNIILILGDDLGYGDLSCYGSSNIKTPNIDKLAKEGVRFTNFYANAPECTPTRTALLTGRYQQRVGGLECAIGLGNIGRYPESLALSDKGELGLPIRFNVLPTILNEKGYHTAIIGKWHLGDAAQFSPAAHGFNYSIGPLGGAVDYFHHSEPVGVFMGTKMYGDTDLYRNGNPDDRDGYYMTHLITDESVEWINNQKENQPFFLYVPYTAPHEPLQGPDDYSPDKMTMKGWGEGNKETYTKVVEEMDKGVGKILAKLDEKGFTDNTLVIFFSDNGPTDKGSAGPFSGHKGEVFEGGIRVPCIIRWPGKIEPDISSDQMAISMDITASISEIINADPVKPLDGIDLIGHVANKKNDYQRTLFWRKLRGKSVLKAVREGNLKYVKNTDNNETKEYLFDLTADPAEINNLKESKKIEFNKLKKLLEEWEGEVWAERYSIDTKKH